MYCILLIYWEKKLKLIQGNTPLSKKWREDDEGHQKNYQRLCIQQGNNARFLSFE